MERTIEQTRISDASMLELLFPLVDSSWECARNYMLTAPYLEAYKED